MAYWWVSQNKTYNEEREGGYLWAPLSDKGGHTPHHWRNMKLLNPGDIVFSYRQQKIFAISAVTSKPYHSDAPTDFQRKGDWSQNGLRADSAYEDLQPPLSIASVRSELMALLPAKYSPLNSEGTGNQG